MEKIIKLDTKKKKYLEQLKRVDGEESKTYVLRTPSFIIKTGYTKERCKYIALPRGPVITEGQELSEGLEVQSIDYVENYGYTITFK